MAARSDASLSLARDHEDASAESAPEPQTLPKLIVRGRSFMALIVTPEAPLNAWFTALDQHIRRTGDFFADRPVVANLSAAAQDGGRGAVLDALDRLAARDLRLIGVEGVEPMVLTGSRWARLPTILHGRETRAETRADPPLTVRPAASRALLIDRPVRSGQTILFEEGDVTVIGSVASGAEVIAGGSIHVYGALRGRAIAGVRTGAEARIFCRRLEAELVAVNGCYLTAEHWGGELQGCAAQIRCEANRLTLSAID
jgi:septum site-determining protein MinC